MAALTDSTFTLTLGLNGPQVTQLEFRLPPFDRRHSKLVFDEIYAGIELPCCLSVCYQAAYELRTSTCLMLLHFSVIYDDELTAAFFRTAHRIMSQSPPKTLYIALERR